MEKLKQVFLNKFLLLKNKSAWPEADIQIIKIFIFLFVLTMMTILLLSKVQRAPAVDSRVQIDGLVSDRVI